MVSTRPKKTFHFGFDPLCHIGVDNYCESHIGPVVVYHILLIVVLENSSIFLLGEDPYREVVLPDADNLLVGGPCIVVVDPLSVGYDVGNCVGAGYIDTLVGSSHFAVIP